MSVVNELKGGLGSKKTADSKDGKKAPPDNRDVLKAAARRLAKKGEINLVFPKKEKPAEDSGVEDRKAHRKELSDYAKERASEAFQWILEVARPFLRDLDEEMRDVGSAVLKARCDDDRSQTMEDRKKDYEGTIRALQAFAPENAGTHREEEADEPELVAGLCLHVRHTTALALLIDDLRYAEDKPCLEDTLENAKDEDGKNVFVEKKDQTGCIRAFGRTFILAEGAFGAYHEFACEKLAEAVTARSREQATAHKAEVAKQQEAVSAETETDVTPDELLFGDADEMNEKTAVFSWEFQKHPNALRMERSGNRLYFIGAVGKPDEALAAAEEKLGEQQQPFVLLEHIVDRDGEHLRPATVEGGKPKYDFGVRVKEEVFPLACWLRTAAGICLPNRLWPHDAGRVQAKPESNGRTGKVFADNDGSEVVGPAEFYFRVNGGAGTLAVNLPEGFILHLDEVKDEQQALVAPAHEVKLTKAAVVKIRRAIVGGKAKIILQDCDDVAVMQELTVNGIPGREWTETGEKGWKGLPSPLPGILSFRYKAACNAGEIKPNKRK